jgi:hypothetical protein
MFLDNYVDYDPTEIKFPNVTFTPPVFDTGAVFVIGLGLLLWWYWKGK